MRNKSKGTVGLYTRNSGHGKRLKSVYGLAPPVNDAMPHPTTAVRVLILQLVDNPTEWFMVNMKQGFSAGCCMNGKAFFHIS